MVFRIFMIFILAGAAYSQALPPIGPGVSHDLAKWRAAHYSDVRYNLQLTLEKMSPVLKGTIEIRVNVGTRTPLSATPKSGDLPPIILDWRKIKGHESLSTITNVSVNGTTVKNPVAMAPGSDTEHLIFSDGVVAGENVIKLDFTSPILTSGSAVTRYVDKEDGAEYLYSLFVPSDASTAFPVFDQPDLKARFTLSVVAPKGWKVISNTNIEDMKFPSTRPVSAKEKELRDIMYRTVPFAETKPISTYVLSFATGEFTSFKESSYFRDAKIGLKEAENTFSPAKFSKIESGNEIFVRKSQAEKFKPHAAEVFRLNREGIKYLESYFDYKFPFPKYDIVLIPEFPFGGMEHAGATFLREDRVIFPTEPTKNDYITRANVIFHEAAHQWFGDTVTMKWFDDLWLKEGFAEFMAYKTLEHVMPETNAWKVFYERNKQAAYLTDSTKGTTPIYQKIDNLSAAKSAYGNIVYRKAPSFLRQAEFYIGEKEFQTAVRAFLKKHEYANADWQDLVKEFEAAYLASTKGKPIEQLNGCFSKWVTQPGLPTVRVERKETTLGLLAGVYLWQLAPPNGPFGWCMKTKVLFKEDSGNSKEQVMAFQLMEQGAKSGQVSAGSMNEVDHPADRIQVIFPNYEDYGYGIFLLDDKSRGYVLRNIQNEKDPFLRSMMWGSLWDSVREGELDPKDYVELVLKVLMQKPAREQGRNAQHDDHAQASAIEDESTTALLLANVSTAMKYYLQRPDREQGRNAQDDDHALANARASAPDGLQARIEDMLIAGMQNAPTVGQRITYFRALLNIASNEKSRTMLKELLAGVRSPHVSKGSTLSTSDVEPSLTVGLLTIRTKDKFDIVTRLLILGDPEAPKLLAELEKTEPADEAKRYAYAAKAGIGTAENKAKYWKDLTENKDISESWLEDALRPFNSLEHSDATLPYLEKALNELPKLKRDRKIFFVNSWLSAFIGGQRSQKALDIINKVLTDNPNLDNDLRLKILENADLIERALKIRKAFPN